MVDMLKVWPSNNLHSIYNTRMVNSEGLFETILIANDKDAPI